MEARTPKVSQPKDSAKASSKNENVQVSTEDIDVNKGRYGVGLPAVDL